VATVLALIASASAFFAPAVAGSLPRLSDTAARSTVYRFYDALNVVLRTGDAAALDAVTTTDLATSDAFGQGLGRAALARRLAALHAADPSVQLIIDEAIVDGERAVVRLHASGGEGTTAHGPIGDAASAWPPFDLLRLAGDRIAEFAAVGDDGLRWQPLLGTAFAPADAPAGVRFARVTFAAGTMTAKALAPAPVLIVVESGELHVSCDATPLDGIAQTTGANPPPGEPADWTLRAGDAIVVPGEVWFDLRTSMTTPASVIAASANPALTRPGAFFRPLSAAANGNGALPAAWPSGITVDPLPSGPATAVGGSRDVTIARLTLAPGATWLSPKLTGVALLAVEAGRLGLIGGADVTVAPAAGPDSPARAGRAGCGAGGSLAPGQSATLAAGAVAALCNAGAAPVSVLIIGIASNGAG
jgi:hypothetical protein